MRIRGDKGEVQGWPIFRPTKTKLILRDGAVDEKTWTPPRPGIGSGWSNGFGSRLHDEGVGHGMFWEADEAGCALLQGRLESRSQSLEETILIMGMMDEFRRQGSFRLPENIETTDYPVDL